ncbi:hypothetical protein TcCL_NonESM10846 [Trypanosoma cruzi]|uniref:Uncharacterized protein n=1 Tax=Trypanosoma cruzi (strain CL Brener) TaxID=353153 RepID=Q4E192_TRYCC|nr:hypothetical protein Tc00.1047053506459.190 [Trypanosoma cruzi]EAN98539.1 hypothetical protein Tc00.1047053506459.190 [Trypanosoma cruzi]RNC39762.1 hypothetical protein TcCL_NonESM10846 [Trypanosoma cruzi]|eukprot:XP_820390.1 hypothetical protein [Trypanosoma cruzi strain CL Brener]
MRGRRLTRSGADMMAPRLPWAEARRPGRTEEKALAAKERPASGSKKAVTGKFLPAARPFVPPGPRGVAKRFSLADLTSSWRHQVSSNSTHRSLRGEVMGIAPDESVFTKNLLIHCLVFPPGYADPADNDSDGSHKGKEQIYIQFGLARKCPSPQPSPLLHQATHTAADLGFQKIVCSDAVGVRECYPLLSPPLLSLDALVPDSRPAGIGIDRHTSTCKYAQTHTHTNTRHVVHALERRER